MVNSSSFINNKKMKTAWSFSSRSSGLKVTDLICKFMIHSACDLKPFPHLLDNCKQTIRPFNNHGFLFQEQSPLFWRRANARNVSFRNYRQHQIYPSPTQYRIFFRGLLLPYWNKLLEINEILFILTNRLDKRSQVDENWSKFSLINCRIIVCDQATMVHTVLNFLISII